MKFGLTEKQYQLIIEQIQKFPEIKKVIIFGSRAMGNYRPSSDIDLFIVGPEVTHQTLIRLFGILNDEVSVPFQFDLMREAELTPEIKKHIEQYGVMFVPMQFT